MLNQSKEQLLQSLVKDASQQELIWINGFLSGLLASEKRTETAVTVENTAPQRITILYATETGNAKSLATKLAAFAKKQSVKTKLESVEQYKTASLAKEENLFIVISTQGDGEPPAGAKKFYDFLHNNAPGLNNVKYGVIALGDSSYPLFCKAGEDVDIQLEKLGAQRFANLIKCDTDYETPAAQWFEAALKNLVQQNSNKNTVALPQVAAPAKHTKKIYKGVVSSIVNLNDKDSAKETYHIEIDAEDVVYQPGDSIGILPLNGKEAVNEIITLLNAKAGDIVFYKDEEINLFDVLHTKLNIAYLPERTVRKYATLTNQQIPDTKISLNDLLKIYPLADTISVEDIIKILEPLTPRLYSISSSPSAHDSVHITVSKNTFRLNDSTKYGLCSNYLSGFATGQELEFYVHPNNSFRLPEEDKDVIMIGPGTGIAPFRSFLFERDAAGAGAKNWLFFGDQHFTSDFLYQTEIQDFLETGVLTKFNGAFSRDQQEKIYVQHKMEQNGKELVEWLDNGAHVYICGAKEPMSYDVEKVLLQIISKEKNIDETQAVSYFEQLKESGRLVKDVY